MRFIANDIVESDWNKHNDLAIQIATDTIL